MTTSSANALYRTLPQGQLRSEEHTSELQSQSNLVCRHLLEKKKRKRNGYSRLRDNSLQRRRLLIAQEARAPQGLLPQSLTVIDPPAGLGLIMKNTAARYKSH